ncbi:hypothetical protein HanPI659440_Chr00c08g0720471 [Helianthus annuus]|nr:hypothetical protein HanPI659440_Chr09g0348461 [Helianthus annuus]KAJ0817189.1 hypothetical protein HanPI659440_Chr00c08g0720471 [Helianthus annuus]
MFRSVSDLKESGVKVKKAENCQPLDVSFKKGVLKIAPVSMDDYRFTLFRNMVAFEQCHFGCKPHVNSLCGNKHAARLVNKLCKEVAGAADDSYLRDVLWEINCYCNDGWHQKRAKLKHEYFYNVWVSVATIAAILVIYLTILQTVWGLGDDGNRAHMLRTGFWRSMADAFAIPFGVSKPSENAPVPVENEAQILEWFFGYKACDDPNFFFMSC